MQDQQTTTDNNLRLGHEMPPMLGFGNYDAKPAEAEQPDTSSPSDISASAEDLGLGAKEEKEPPGGIDTSKTRPPLDEEKLKKDLRADVHAMQVSGVVWRGADQTGRDAAVNGLAKILAIHYRFFHNKPADEYLIAVKTLEAQIPKLSKHKGRTPLHLLSRIFRDNQSKQSSGDATVLKQAIDEVVTESDFPAWVKKCGGLDAIIKGVNKAHRDAKGKAPIDAKKLYERADTVIKELSDNEQYKSVISLDINTMPPGFDVIIPKAGERLKAIAVTVKNGKLVFSELVDHVPVQSGANAAAGPVEIDEDDWDVAFAKQNAKSGVDLELEEM